MGVTAGMGLVQFLEGLLPLDLGGSERTWLFCASATEKSCSPCFFEDFIAAYPSVYVQ